LDEVFKMATIGAMSLGKGEILTTSHMYSINRANDGYGFLTGCDVHQKASPGMGVTVDSGSVMYAGSYVAVTGGDVVIDTADGTYPRMDIIYVASNGSISVAKGTAAAILPGDETAFKKMISPYPTASVPAGVILARVYVAAGVTSILDAAIDDIAMQLTQVPLSILTARGDIPFRGANTWEKLAKGSTGQFLGQGANDPAWTTRYYHLEFPFGDGNTLLQANSKMLIEVPITGKIIEARCFSGDVISGSITFGVWQDQYADGIPTVADSIATYSISSDTKSEYTGLNLAVTCGDMLVVNINSTTSMKCVTLSLRIEAT
jgi:hypothetical protein